MKIENQKYNQLTSEELNKINGGGFVKMKRVENSEYTAQWSMPDGTIITTTYWQEQRYTWWGLYGTTDIIPCSSPDN
jgi:bacteriocin-like protein